MAKVMLTREEYLRRQGLLEETKSPGVNINLGWIIMVIVAVVALSSIFKKEEE